MAVSCPWVAKFRQQMHFACVGIYEQNVKQNRYIVHLKSLLVVKYQRATAGNQQWLARQIGQCPSRLQFIDFTTSIVYNVNTQLIK